MKTMKMDDDDDVKFNVYINGKYNFFIESIRSNLYSH